MSEYHFRLRASARWRAIRAALGGLVLVVGRGEPHQRASRALFVAAASADDDQAGFQRAVVAVTTSAAARFVGGQDLVVVDRAAGRAWLFGVGDPCSRPVGGKRTRDRCPGLIPAADDGLAAVVGLLDHRGVDAVADRRCDPGSAIVDDLSAGRVGGSEPATIERASSSQSAPAGNHRPHGVAGLDRC